MFPILFFVRTAWAIQGLLWFHMNFRIALAISVKYHWNFYRDDIESVESFGYYGHFYNIKLEDNLPIYEHRMSFHLFMSSLISFTNAM